MGKFICMSFSNHNWVRAAILLYVEHRNCRANEAFHRSYRPLKKSMTMTMMGTIARTRLQPQSRALASGLAVGFDPMRQPGKVRVVLELEPALEIRRGLLFQRRQLNR
jgi:hypothetical protein